MTQKHRETDKVQMHEDTKKETPGEIQRDRDRKRRPERERNTETEKERDRERERWRETEKG